jgi:hypothetical protein
MQRVRDVRRGFIRARGDDPTAQLVELTGSTPFALRALLDAYGVQLVRAGRTVLVPRTEIEDKIPLSWKNLWRLESWPLRQPEAMPTEERGARRGSSPRPTRFLSARRRFRGAQQGSE